VSSYRFHNRLWCVTEIGFVSLTQLEAMFPEPQDENKEVLFSDLVGNARTHREEGTLSCFVDVG